MDTDASLAPTDGGERRSVTRHRLVKRLLCISILVGATAVITSGCSGNREEQVGDVTAACNRLEDLSRAVLSVRAATTSLEVRTAIEQPLAAFVSAADLSGDDELAGLSRAYDSSFSVYLNAEGADARAAGEDANIALDRAGQHSSELGATNSFPQQS